MAKDFGYIERTTDPVLLGRIVDNTYQMKNSFTEEEAQEVRRRALVQLWKVIAGRNAPLTTLEWDLWYAFGAYESVLSINKGKKSYAKRLRQKIKKSDIFEAACGAVRRGGSAFGFQTLLDMNFLEASFERIVLKHAHAFPEDVVERAHQTLKKFESGQK